MGDPSETHPQEHTHAHLQTQAPVSLLFPIPHHSAPPTPNLCRKGTEIQIPPEAQSLCTILAKGILYFKDLLGLHLKACGTEGTLYGTGETEGICVGLRVVHGILSMGKAALPIGTCPSCGTGLQIWVQRHPSNSANLLFGNLWQTRLINFLNSRVKGS